MREYHHQVTEQGTTAGPGSYKTRYDGTNAADAMAAWSKWAYVEEE